MLANLHYFIIILFFIIACVNGETCFRFQLEGIKDDDGIENKILTDSITYDMKVDNDTGDINMVMGGHVAVDLTIGKSVKMDLDVLRDTENGKQQAFSISLDICKSINDDPLLPIVKGMGIEGCDIMKDKYSLTETPEISLEPIKDYLSEAYEGAYEVKMVFYAKDDPSLISLHTVAARIESYDCE
ncbi:uncharacterized protein LOC128676505 [Plodia interpunctella]|uniref:uncharacterized protein LOC128676505 n=1 Tax=Plodia interpunctella TaxID=58824 RepID=UPI002367DF51|nr:uncharacterized protein LOC128676505 [Plodia interpunctella]